MRISRFHIPGPIASGQCLDLPAATAHYLVNVLRLTPGTAVRIFDGEGHEFAAILSEAGKKQARVELWEPVTPTPESPLHVHLALGLTRGERMDFAIQKATELGASVFTPVITDRCEMKLKGDRSEKKREHWQQVAISACEQSGRAVVPVVHDAVPLAEFLAKTTASLKLILDHRQASSLPGMPGVADLILLTGPEGGFTDVEIDQALKADYRAVRLGERVMRAETAPLAALAILQWTGGDFSSLA